MSAKISSQTPFKRQNKAKGLIIKHDLNIVVLYNMHKGIYMLNLSGFIGVVVSILVVCNSASLGHNNRTGDWSCPMYGFDVPDGDLELVTGMGKLRRGETKRKVVGNHSNWSFELEAAGIAARSLIRINLRY